MSKIYTAITKKGRGDQNPAAFYYAIKDDCLTTSGSIGERRFHDAFSLGAKLMIEILASGPQRLRRTLCNFREVNSINKTKGNKYRHYSYYT